MEPIIIGELITQLENGPEIVNGQRNTLALYHKRKRKNESDTYT